MITYLLRLLWATFWTIIYMLIYTLSNTWFLLFDWDEVEWKLNHGMYSYEARGYHWIIWYEEGEWESFFHWALKIN